MKTTLTLLLALAISFACRAQAAKAAPAKQLKVGNRSSLFAKLITNLSPTDANLLWRRYRAEARLLRTSRNRHDPSITDSVLTVHNAADQLTLFKNTYKVMLLAGMFSSDRVSFAGLKVGVAQPEFCRMLRLPLGYSSYAISDGQEQFLQLIFSFSGGHLQQVEYKMLQSLNAID